MSTLISAPSSYRNIEMSDEELNQHMLIIGTTGAGKTNTILNFVDSAISRNLPCVYLDGKGSVDLIDKLGSLATKYNRVFKVFTLRPDASIPNLAAYNTFSAGNATEWKNRIMSLFAEAQGKGQEHFSLAEQNYINFVSNVLYQHSQKTGHTVDLKILLSFLENPDLLEKLAGTVDPVLAGKLEKIHNDKETKHMATDVVRLLELFIYSSYGDLLSTDGKSTIINLRESILNNEVVLFLFDASAYPEDTKKMAKMVINDINSCFSSFKEFTKCFCIFDEFGSYASSNLAETISLQRSQGMHAIIGTQSITTVKLKSSETRRIAEELIACCNSFIIHRVNHADDAEIFAQVIGTKNSAEYSTTIYDKPLESNKIDIFRRKNENEDLPRAIGNMSIVEKYKINPEELKTLKQGEAIIYRKVTNTEAIRIQIRNVFAVEKAPESQKPLPPRTPLQSELIIWGIAAIAIIVLIIFWKHI